MKSLKRQKHLLFLLPSLTGVGIFVLIPFADVIRRSFFVGSSGRFCGLENYREVFHNEAFRLAVKNTVNFTAVCLPLLVCLGLLFALILSRLEKIRFLKSMFLFPMAIPVAAVVLLWKMIFYKSGFLNLLLSQMDFALRAGFAHDAMAAPDYMNSGGVFWVLVFSYIWRNLGYTIVLWLAGIWAVPGDILEAARVDGAGDVACFTRILLPNLRGTLYTITVLSFLNSFKVFREAYLVAGAYPHKKIYLLQHLFNNWFLDMELQKMAAAAVCVGAVLLLVILLLERLWEDF